MVAERRRTKRRLAEWRQERPRPSSVGAVVRRTHFGLLACVWTESALFCISASLLTVAAGVQSGLPLNRLELWVTGIFCGVLCGLGWWREQDVPLAEVVRGLDERLRHQGALITAFELERTPDRSPFAPLIQERVLTRLRYAEAMRALLPPLAPPVAAPLVAGLLLTVAVEAARPPAADPAADPVLLFAGSIGELEAAAERALEETEAGSLDADSAAQILRLKRELRAFEERVAEAQADGSNPAELLPDLEALDREVARTVAERQADPELRRHLQAARTWLDAARMGWEEARDEGAEPAPGPGDTASAETEPGGEFEGRGGAGTMGGSASAPTGSDTGSGAAPEVAVDAGSSTPSSLPEPRSSLEKGGGSARWWADEYDSLVARWIEARRRALDPKASEESP